MSSAGPPDFATTSRTDPRLFGGLQVSAASVTHGKAAGKTSCLSVLSNAVVISNTHPYAKSWTDCGRRRTGQRTKIWRGPGRCFMPTLFPTECLIFPAANGTLDFAFNTLKSRIGLLCPLVQPEPTPTTCAGRLQPPKRLPRGNRLWIPAAGKFTNPERAPGNLPARNAGRSSGQRSAPPGAWSA